MSIERCKRGHDLVEDNIAARPYRGERCIECRRHGDRSDECECGRPKKVTAESCEHCAFLDGRSTAPAQALIIAALRLTEELSLIALNDAVFAGKPSQRRAVLRSLNEMVKDGRVQKRWEEGESFIRPCVQSWRSRTPFEANGSFGGRYVYRLCAPARGEIKRAA